jgi:hypothetical protein
VGGPRCGIRMMSGTAEAGGVLGQAAEENRWFRAYLKDLGCGNEIGVESCRLGQFPVDQAVDPRTDM